MILLSLVAAISAQVEPPRTANGGVLGTAAEFRTRGPARLCLKHSGFDAARGETVYLDYLGIHAGGVRVHTRRSRYSVTEGDTWGTPRGEAGRAIRGTRHRRVVRYASPDGPQYLIYGRPDYSPNRDHPVVWLRGPALTGTNSDRRILNRIDVQLTDFDSCDRRFGYGWDGVFATRSNNQ